MASLDSISSFAGIPGLIHFIFITCRTINDLQDIVKGAKGLRENLETLAEILQDVCNKYSTLTVNTVPTTSGSMKNMLRCIRQCEQTIVQIDKNLKKVGTARNGTKTFKAWWEEAALKTLKEDLGSQISVLQLALNPLRSVGTFFYEPTIGPLTICFQA